MRKCNQQEMLERIGCPFTHNITICLLAFFKIHYWLEGFLVCSLCCSTPLFWVLLCKLLLVILELTQISEFMHSWAGNRRLACNKASNDACIIDKRWCPVLSMFVSINVDIDKQKSVA